MREVNIVPGKVHQQKPRLEVELAAQRRRTWIGACVFVLAGSLAVGLHLATPKSVPWAVAGGKLQIHSLVWSDDFPVSELQMDRARIVDLNQEPGWLPKSKSLGYNGGGYRAGRFRLKNGTSADIYLTNETKAVLIPRRGAIPVIVGARNPEPLVAALRNAPASAMTGR